MVASFCRMQIFSFTSVYMDPVLCSSFIEICAYDFERSQGGMYVAAYEANFHELSRYATELVTIEEERIYLFIRD